MTGNFGGGQNLPQLAQGLAGKLACVFGDALAMSMFYHDEIIWRLPPSFGALAGPYCGKAAVVAFQQGVTLLYDVAKASSLLLAEAHTGATSMARLMFNAPMLPSGAPFSGEYVLCVTERDGLAVEVVEVMDSLAIWRARSAVGQADLFEG